MQPEHQYRVSKAIAVPKQKKGHIFTEFRRRGAEAYARKVQRLVGEVVALTGGGGDCTRLARLQRVSVVPRPKSGFGVRVKLQFLKGYGLPFKGGHVFEPWIGSWKIHPTRALDKGGRRA